MVLKLADLTAVLVNDNVPGGSYKISLFYWCDSSADLV